MWHGAGYAVNTKYIVDEPFSFCHGFAMDKESHLKALEERCFAARISMSEAFKLAKVSGATLARWRKDPNTMRATTLAKVEQALSDARGQGEQG